MPDTHVSPTMTIQGENYYNIGDSAQFTGLSVSGFKYRVDRFNKEVTEDGEPPIKKYQFRGEGRQRFFKESDLKRLMELVESDDWGETSEE